MARKRSRSTKDDVADLNLAPMMNMVMILIPMLALMAVFVKAGVINISSPQNAQATQQNEDQPEEPEQVPRVVVSISEDGFRVIDQRNLPTFQQFTSPIDGCPGAGAVVPAGSGAVPGGASPHAQSASMPPTICLREGVDASAPLMEQLDFAALYNRLLQIRINWYDALGEEGNDVISILGELEVPYEVIVGTMDAARYFLAPPGSELPEPSAASEANTYFLGGQLRANASHLLEAQYLTVGANNDRVEMFPNPVLLLPRPGGS